MCVYLRVIIISNCYFKDKQDEVNSERETTPAVSVEAAVHTAGEATEEPEAEEYVSADEGEPDLIVDLSSGDSLQEKEESCVPCPTCLTVQPNRIPCGVRLQSFSIHDNHHTQIAAVVRLIFKIE